MNDPIEVADAGLSGGESAAGRLMKDVVGEDVVEDEAVEAGEARPAGTTSG
jgi:hypothetical protein